MEEESFIDEISSALKEWTEATPYASLGEREAYRKGYIDGCIETLKSPPANP